MQEVRRQGLDERPAGSHERQVDVVDQAAAGVPVAGQGALGQQLVAAHGRGASATRWRSGARTARPGPTTCGAGEVGGDRSDDHGTLAELVDDTQRRLVGIVHPAEHHHQPLALGGAQGVHAAAPRGAAYLLEDVGLGALGRHPPEHDGHVAAGPQPRALARESTVSSVSERSTASTTSASSRASHAPRTSAARA